VTLDKGFAVVAAEVRVIDLNGSRDTANYRDSANYRDLFRTE